jgi:hypothetical protein
MSFLPMSNLDGTMSMWTSWNNKNNKNHDERSMNVVVREKFHSSPSPRREKRGEEQAAACIFLKKKWVYGHIRFIHAYDDMLCICCSTPAILLEWHYSEKRKTTDNSALERCVPILCDSTYAYPMDTSIQGQKVNNMMFASQSGSSARSEIRGGGPSSFSLSFCDDTLPASRACNSSKLNTWDTPSVKESQFTFIPTYRWIRQFASLQMNLKEPLAPPLYVHQCTVQATSMLECNQKQRWPCG